MNKVSLVNYLADYFLFFQYIGVYTQGLILIFYVDMKFCNILSNHLYYSES